MNKHGEINRFSQNVVQYIIGVEKIEAPHLKNELYVPHLYFHITRKTSKKKRGNKLDKSDRMFSLASDTWNLSATRKIISCFKQYLDEIKPQHISFSLYGTREEKRKRSLFYVRRLREMGYRFTKCDDKTWENYPVFYMERKKDA